MVVFFAYGFARSVRDESVVVVALIKIFANCRQSLILATHQVFAWRQRSLQYRTFGQSRAHFFRHSKGLAQVSQIFGAKPFFVRGTRVISVNSITA